VGRQPWTDALNETRVGHDTQKERVFIAPVGNSECVTKF
jgi:hypothetical protein